MNTSSQGLQSLPTLAVGELLRAYRRGELKPAALIEALYQRIDAEAGHGVWISRIPREQALQQARALGERDPSSLPLYGIPFAIKDNIDLAGVPTTAACAEFAYTPAASAFVVERLLAAGAIPLGKTNLDQFATGLVGMRSPYGVSRNSFDPAYIAGGSSSGSALAVALGLASFALGSDTAGSGRVPAAFNNLIGLKPTAGRLSCRGMVPACRTLDVMSIFTLDAEDAARVARVAAGFDASEPYSRRAPPLRPSLGAAGRLRVGVPRAEQLQFFGNREYERLFGVARSTLEGLGAELIEIDFAPFTEAAGLLYGGPWLVERYLVIEPLLRRSPEAIHPITRGIIERGALPSAADAFRAQYQLQGLRRSAELLWQRIDVLLTPTAGTHPTLEAVEANPVSLNSQLGYYTNGVNLLDLAAVAVPAGFTAAGLPFGVTLVGPPWSDEGLLAWGARLQRASSARAGALGVTLPAEPAFEWEAPEERLELAVCGAHLDGLPLNHQLRERGAVLLERTRTAARYRLFALPGGPPSRPGLLRDDAHGSMIEVELWSLPSAAFGSFVAPIPAPLVIGKVMLADGREVSGFLCEAGATAGAEEISQFGGWRAYLAARL
jgi:allophanate hydrolase